MQLMLLLASNTARHEALVVMGISQSTERHNFQGNSCLESLVFAMIKGVQAC